MNFNKYFCEAHNRKGEVYQVTFIGKFWAFKYFHKIKMGTCISQNPEKVITYIGRIKSSVPSVPQP